MEGTFQFQTPQRSARCHLSRSVAPEALLSIRQWIGTTLVPAGGADRGTAPSHPLAIPIPSPASRARAPASPAPPAPGSPQSPRLARDFLARRPSFIATRELPKV